MDQPWNANIHYDALLDAMVPLGTQCVLDVGCGDGLLAARLARRIPYVTAVDIDAPVLRRAQASRASGNIPLRSSGRPRRRCMSYAATFAPCCPGRVSVGCCTAGCSLRGAHPSNRENPMAAADMTKCALACEIGCPHPMIGGYGSQTTSDRQLRSASGQEPKPHPQPVGVDHLWSRGHVTYAPDDAALAARLRASTGLGEVWRCLRCGDFALGGPQGRGAPEDAPLIMRGKALRQAIIIRALGVERLVRALVLALAAWAVWEFRGARGAIQATLDRDLPVLRAAGFKVDQMTVIHALEKALAAKPSTLALITGMLAAYAVLQAVEGVGLWLLKRWGEYFAVVATSIFLPLEVHDLAKGITTTRVVTFSINVAAVVYLLISKRLFGVRGGRKAYDVERRGEQLLDLERAAMLT